MSMYNSILYNGRIRPALKPSIWSTAARHINTMRDLKDFRSHIKQHKKLSEDKKELILTILSSAATKREARSYLEKYPLLVDTTQSSLHHGSIDPAETDTSTPENNKYDFMVDSLLMKYSNNSSFDIDTDHHDTGEKYLSNVLRLALIKIRNLRHLPIETILGIGRTIHKMVQLGVSPVIVMDMNEELNNTSKEDINYTTILTRTIMEQSNSLINIFEQKSDEGLSFRSVRGLFEYDSETNNYRFSIPELLAIPLAQGIIPIIYPIAVETKDSKQRFMSSFEVMKTVTNEVIKVNDLYHNKNTNDDLITIEKVIYIDPLGGIPSLERFKSSHVFVNLLQELDEIEAELYIGFLKPEIRDIHLNNLREMNEILTLIPNATGIITTPKIATLKKDVRLVNPIIYNILTDRPIISSSLPVNLKETPQLNTTILKKGMDIEIFSSHDTTTGMDLIKEDQKGRIDLSKLKHLIEDGFQREIDMYHYLQRVNGKIASVIIAGDYEGGAIITWETSTIDGETRVIPYLDKFFVLKKLQGIPGIADVVFKSLQTKYAEELLWRSRKNNPVNKWYFARSLGNISIKDSQWRVFFSGTKKFSLLDYRMYIDICSKIEPSFK